MSKAMWAPSPERVAQATITKFANAVSERFGVDTSTYADLHRWSVENVGDFWDAVWDYCGVIGERGEGPAYAPGQEFFEARFFPEARLNFAENLLRRNDDGIALIARREDGLRTEVTFAELQRQVGALAHHLKELGIGAGDRVAAYLPNGIEAVVASLAAASLGAVWSSCSPDFGVRGAVDRFEQVEPKVLFGVDTYYFRGKFFDIKDRIFEIVAELPSLQHVIVSEQSGGTGRADRPESWQDYSTLTSGDHAPEFERLPFDHPLYILFSSGTTGKPKCIVHRAGGVLLMHLREHQLHSDVNEGDRLFYFTTCGWMMWNWLVSGLASNATLVLYDGSPMDPEPDSLFKMAGEEGVTIFGTSAKFLSALENSGATPKDSANLQRIRAILSTGSPLSVDGFDYVYNAIKEDVCLSSISGGTDLVGCLVAGNPAGAVHRGECQVPTLGMDTTVFDNDGNRIRNAMGELVCTTPFPTVPLGFLNDPDNARFRAAYFDRFPGVWHHGDLVSQTDTGGFVIHGRSDAVLNAGGVRIGTAEIYRPVEAIPEVLEALAIGQIWNDDTRIVLFVTLADNHELDDDLVQRIRSTLRTEASPRHVPAKILQVPELPRTKSGKIVELAVREVVEGRPVKNIEALANPDALDHFANRPELAEG